MRSKVTLLLCSLAFLAAVAPTASAADARRFASDLAFAQADSTAAPDTAAAAPDTSAAQPVTPAPAAAPAVAPAVTTPPPAATPPPAPAPAAAAPAAAPPPAKSGPNEKIYYGGTVTLSFGSTMRLGFFPMLGYKISPRLSAGAEIGYEYVSYDSDQSTSNYGGSVFGRYRVGRNLYAHAEYQSMNYEIFDRFGGSEREWVPALLLGGGFVKPLSGRSAMYAEVLFDVLQDENSPYSDWTPVVNFGVSVGF